MNRHDHVDAERHVETRLRHALEARTRTITAADLRPADPPRPPLGRSALPRLTWPARRLVLPLAALAATAATVIGALTLAPDTGPPRPQPASSPRPAPLSPTTTPSVPDTQEPTPSARPSTGGTPTEEPSTAPTPTRSPTTPFASAEPTGPENFATPTPGAASGVGR